MGVQMYHVEASPTPLADITTSSVLGLRGPPYSQETMQPPPLPSKVTFRIPVNVVNHALPDLVDQFTKRQNDECKYRRHCWLAIACPKHRSM